MKYFVSSDIHGYYDEWVQALKEKQFDIDDPNHQIIVCGDLFDRGSQAKKLQTFVAKLLRKNKIVLIRGNHEDLALELIENYADYMFNIKRTHHWQNGTFQTFLQLTNMTYDDATACSLEFKKRANATDYVKKIIPKMKNFYETDHYIFVHAWIPLKENRYEFDRNWRNASNRLWKKARWIRPLEVYRRRLYPRGKTLVFGHWHCSAFWANADAKRYTEFGKRACFEPFITKEIMAIDACTAESGKVNVVVIED